MNKAQQFTLPNGLIWLCLLLSLTIALIVEHRIFFDLTAVNDDVRNQIYWLARIIDPSLYKNDLIADYFTQPSLISPAVWWLYAVASNWIDPIRFGQFLPFPLIVLTTFFLFKFAESQKGGWYAFWVCWLFNLFIWTVRNFAGGLPRAFSYLLLFLFLWQYEKRNAWGIGLALCLSSLIYPPVALLGLCIILYGFLKHRDTSRQLPKTVWLAVAGGLLLFFWRYAEQTGVSHFGGLNHLPQALQIPEFFFGGRVPLFLLPNLSSHFPWQFLQLPLQVIPHLYITIPVLLFFLIWKGYQKTLGKSFGSIMVPSVIWQLAGISVFLYLLAWLMLFYLYVPERYLQFTLPVVIVFALASIFTNLSHTRQKQKLRLVGLILFPLLVTVPLWQADLIQPSPDSQALMQFLKTTPKNSMISANLGVSSNIPAFAKRSVFLSHEGYIPFHRDYFHIMKHRLRSWLSGYYATRPSALKTFIDQHPTDYIVIDTNDYESDRLTHLAKNFYHAFDTEFFQQLNQGTDKHHYILYQLADRHAIYRNETYLVVSTIDLKNALASTQTATN